MTWTQASNDVMQCTSASRMLVTQGNARLAPTLDPAPPGRCAQTPRAPRGAGKRRHIRRKRGQWIPQSREEVRKEGKLVFLATQEVRTGVCSYSTVSPQTRGTDTLHCELVDNIPEKQSPGEPEGSSGFRAKLSTGSDLSTGSARA